MNPDRENIFLHRARQMTIRKCRIQHRQLMLYTLTACLLGDCPRKIQLQLIIDLHKQLCIIWILHKPEDIADVHHRPLSKKKQLCIFNPILDFISFQEIHKRQHALIIPVENCRFTPAIRRSL